MRILDIAEARRWLPLQQLRQRQYRRLSESAGTTAYQQPLCSRVSKEPFQAALQLLRTVLAKIETGPLPNFLRPIVRYNLDP